MKLDMTETRLDSIGNLLYNTGNAFDTTIRILRVLQQDDNTTLGSDIYNIITMQQTSKYTQINFIINAYDNLPPQTFEK